MNKKINIATAAVFLAVLVGFAVAFWAMPDKDFSAEENRTLQTLPDISLDDWLNGKLSARFNTYFTDQLPFRTELVGLSALTDLALGRGESNGVLLGEGEQLAVRRFDAYLSLTQRAEDTDYFSEAHIRSQLASLEALDDTLDIPLTVLLAPRTVDVTVGGSGYPAELSDRLNSVIEDALSASGVQHIPLLDTLRAMHSAGESVYYRTDHHWTTLGAYTAYRAILTAWGMEDELLPADAFTVRTVPDFYGTTWSRAGLHFVSPDTLELWELPTDTDYVVKDGDGEVLLRGFIDESYLSGKDKYGAFLSGTRSLLTVTDTADTQDGDRPRLLLAKDSFANAAVPFLARHFDLVVVNLTGGMTELFAYAEAYDCDRVLVLCNLENLVTGDAVGRIK